MRHKPWAGGGGRPDSTRRLGREARFDAYDGSHRWGAKLGAIIGRQQATSGRLKRSITEIEQA
jgi:hypothetical protein